MPGKNIVLKILINTALGIFLIFIWLRFVNIQEVLVILGNARPKYALFFFLFFALAGVFRGIRLKFLLKEYKVAFKDLVMLNFLSQFLSFMIPIRAGEISKSVYLTSQIKVPIGKTITWVFVDRSLDLVGILIFITFLLPFIPTSLPSNFSQIAAVILAFFFIFFVISIKSQNFFKKTMVFLSNFLIVGFIKRLFVSFTHTIIEGLAVLHRKPVDIAGFIALTMIALTFDSLAWMSVFWTMGIDISFLKVILGNGLEAFTFLIPAAPGYVGSAEAAGLAVWAGLLGLEANQASALVVFFHIITMLALLILGLASIYTLKFDLNLVWKKVLKKGD